MPTPQHTIVKPQKLVNAYVALLEQSLILPNLFLKDGVEDFKGSANDTITIKVPGRLPSRDYAFRNDRSAGIVFDTYSEGSTTLTFSGNTYSAVKITDEQVDFDLDNPNSLVPVQARAVGEGISRRCVAEVVNAPYVVTLGNAQVNLRRAMIEARKVLNKFNVPAEGRVFIVGSDYEAAMLDDDKLNLASNVGEAEAVSALREAVIGRRYGFTIVADPTLPAGDGYALAADAFALRTAVPTIPQSAPFGATASYEGLALRWIKDYDTEFMQDRSVVNTYVGTTYVKDRFGYWDAASTPKQEKVGTQDHFVRAVKVTLAGETSFAGTAELTSITGVQKSTLWDGDGVLTD